MKAEELRIGNLVLAECPGYRYPQDSEWGEHQITGKDLADWDDEFFKPIPLTEEWLVRFGFDDGYMFIDPTRVNRTKRQDMKTHIYTMEDHKGWGNAINWSNWKLRKVHGHLPRRPQVGDILRCKMESGKIARFEFIEVELCADPRDMFFAKLKDLTYEP